MKHADHNQEPAPAIVNLQVTGQMPPTEPYRDNALTAGRSNVVPLRSSRIGVRRLPSRQKLCKPTAQGLKAVAGARVDSRATAAVPTTPMWVSIAALIGVTMWPSAAVLLVQMSCRMIGLLHQGWSR